MRVLLVDDDPEVRDELNDLLTDSGHRATAVATVAQATSALERDEFDVMFSDIRMGRHSGIDLLVEAKQRWPRMLVIMLTGMGTVKSAVEAMQSGAFDYLLKPARRDQVQRVLELVTQQLALTRVGAEPLDPVQYAKSLAAEGGYEVLLISPNKVQKPMANISTFPLDPDNPFQIRHVVEEFVTPKERAAVVLSSVEELLARHREEEIAKLLEAMRSVLEGKGPLAVGYDPSKITATGALAVRASIVSADAHTTLESLRSPIRRLVLRRLAEGPCTFTQAMEAAQLTDTSKIAFHLRELGESGLITHLARETYQLTSRGDGAIKILNSIDDLDSAKGSGNRVFPSQAQ
ncbi:MAG: response regulator [Thermoplasmata archaeon]|nr:response regulator [Thermoplasmata archaeon]